MRWILFAWGLTTATVLAQEDPVLNKPEAAATGTAELTTPAQQPRDSSNQSPVRAPEAMTMPAVERETSRLQPASDSRALVGGRWVSPQWVLGASSRLPTYEMDSPSPPHPASSRYQPESSPPERAPGLDQQIRPPMVKRYADAPLVRFVAPRDAITNLLEELSLDDLNRYQFRRNRSETVPVERP